MNIFENNIVKKELDRLHNLIGTDGERVVQYDIEILKTALKKINFLLNESVLFAVIDVNMWEECHDSLFKVLSELNLEVDGEKSNYDQYEFYIKRMEDK